VLAPGEEVDRTILVTQVTNFAVTTRAEVRAPTSDLETGDNDASMTTDAVGTVCTIVGSAAPDLLLGGQKPDVVCGLGGDDSVAGLNGNDTLLPGIGDDSVNGGSGVDTVSYADVAAGGVNVNLSLAGAQNTGGAGSDTITAMENVMGTNFEDTLIGSPGNNTASAGGGNDSVSGREGNDTLLPGTGDDLVDGGSGADTVAYTDLEAGGNGVTLNLGITAPQVTVLAGTDTISSIENAAGTNGSDTLTGNPGPNTIHGKDGNDILDSGNGNDVLYPGTGDDSVNGGAGVDTVNYSDLAAGVIVDLLNSFTSDVAGTDRLGLIERITGTNFGDTLTGDDAPNTVKGLGGRDSLFGLGGSDILDGGSGTDTLDGGNGNDSCTFGEVKTNCEA
jgi:Ca2+-binding RTX toxin-like protein